MTVLPRAIALGVVAVVALAGCSAGAQAAARPSSTATSASHTVDNCGTTVEFSGRAPRRVVTIKSTATEMLLALGLGDRIVGTGYQDGPVPAKWKHEAAKVTSLADMVPSEEVVLSTEPDLVYAGWESNFSADGAGERDALTALGVQTYVSPSACKEPAYQPAPLTWKNIDQEIGEVASIFHVSDTKLLAQQQATRARIHPDTHKLTALWYSSGSAAPYVGAGIGAPQLIMKTVGLTNIAAGVKDTWTSFNWESVVAANPDVIVLVDASWNTAAKKIGVLESNPATANLDAVKNHRYIVEPFPATEAGVRTVDAAADVAKQLAKLDLE